MISLPFGAGILPLIVYFLPSLPIVLSGSYVPGPGYRGSALCFYIGEKTL